MISCVLCLRSSAKDAPPEKPLPTKTIEPKPATPSNDPVEKLKSGPKVTRVRKLIKKRKFKHRKKGSKLPNVNNQTSLRLNSSISHPSCISDNDCSMYSVSQGGGVPLGAPVGDRAMNVDFDLQEDIQEDLKGEFKVL